MSVSNISPKILILEDDPAQMDLLVKFALSEVIKFRDNKLTSDKQREIVQKIEIVRVNNIDSLKKSASVHQGVLLALLDCRIPDAKGGTPHDQFVTTNHAVTGQHKTVDIITQQLPGTPITMISSLNRFKTIINRYYKSKHGLNIGFVSKSDAAGIRDNIGHHLQEHMKTLA